jgi:hypothetical protein
MVLKLVAKPADAPTLQERIQALHDEIDALVAARVDEIALDAPGVPKRSIEQLAFARAGGCRCAKVALLQQEE